MSIVRRMFTEELIQPVAIKQLLIPIQQFMILY